MNVLLGITHIFTGLLVIAVSIPLVMGKVSMNRIYGIRFKKSYTSKENWYKINAYGGKQMIIWSIPIVLAGLGCFFIDLKGKPMMTNLIAFAPLILLVPTVTSWWYGRKL